MNNLLAFKDGLIDYIKRNKLLALIVAFGILTIILLLVSTTFTQKKSPPPVRITTHNVTSVPSTPIYVTSTPALEPLNLYDPGLTWSPKTFRETDFQTIRFQKTQLADGSTKYAYPSSNTNRPNEIIVKNGTVVYQRTVIENKYIYHYTNTLDAPDYVFQGSRFYGTNTMAYVYMNSGIAFVADANTTMVREQINFQPTNIEDFKQKYGGDVIDFTIIPTFPAE